MKKRKLGQAGLTAAAALAAATVGTSASADSAADLRKEIAALEARVNGLENQGGLKFANGTTVTIGGYIKTDFIFDFDQALGAVFNAGDITVPSTGLDGQHFQAQARQSRLFIKTETQTSQGPLKTHLEFDFFGGGGNEVFSNSYNPRLRHAYGTWNGWTVGQTWSTFMPIESYPTTVDFEGPSGIPFVRQAQIRYTFPATDNINISIALENSEFSGRNLATGAKIGETAGSGISANIDQLPDLVLAASWSNDKSFVKLATVFRQFNTPSGFPGNDSATGWGVNLSGHTSLWEGGKLNASITYGDGIGRYLIDGGSRDGYIDPVTGQITTISAGGATIGLEQVISPTLTGGLAIGYYKLDDVLPASVGDPLEDLTTVHASLFYKPAKNITFGGEIIYGKKSLVNGTDADATRLQTSVQFNF